MKRQLRDPLKATGVAKQMALVIYIKIHFTSCYYIVTIFVRSCGIIPRLFPSVFSSIFVENSCIAR